jgi:hypothetical protein
MISSTYIYRPASCLSTASRISSPLAASSQNMLFPGIAGKVPKNLTIRIQKRLNQNAPDNVCRAFPARTGDFGPVFPHRCDH